MSTVLGNTQWMMNIEKKIVFFKVNFLLDEYFYQMQNLFIKENFSLQEKFLIMTKNFWP